MFEPCLVSVKDVYGIADPPVPAGKIGVGFRLFKANEEYLTTAYGIGRSKQNGVSPRIILEDKPKRRVFVAEYPIVPDSDPLLPSQVYETFAAMKVAQYPDRFHIEERD